MPASTTHRMTPEQAGARSCARQIMFSAPYSASFGRIPASLAGGPRYRTAIAAVRIYTGIMDDVLVTLGVCNVALHTPRVTDNGPLSYNNKYRMKRNDMDIL